jgi:hypothetical protein
MCFIWRVVLHSGKYNGKLSGLPVLAKLHSEDLSYTIMLLGIQARLIMTRNLDEMYNHV